MAYSPNDIVNWAKISQTLARHDHAKQRYLKGAAYVSDDLDGKLYVERKSLEWQLAQNANADLVYEQANYVLSLCGKYLSQAQLATGGGGSVVIPTAPGATSIKSPIRITGAMFANATTWLGTNNDGITISASYEFEIFWNDIQRFLEEGTEWQRSGAGIEILIPGFNATSTHAAAVFYVYISV